MTIKPRPACRDLPDGDARGVFGADDVFGCLNLLTPERVRKAAGLVKTGRVFSMNGSVMDWPTSSPFGADTRPAPKHVVLTFDHMRDDYLDGFYPQGGTQWDHFLHYGDPHSNSFYNDVKEGKTGMGAWAERGIVGRGVMLDVARWREAQGRPIDWCERDTVSASDLESCAKSHGVDIAEGTILVVRFGWQSGYSALSVDGHKRMSAEVKSAYDVKLPGLEGSAKIAERLWDWGIAAVGADNPAIEAWPHTDSAVLHEIVLSRLGIPFGEFWLVDALAAQCAAEKRCEFLVTSAPLNVPDGVGSPANVLAIM